jgi:hypothetical protein
LLSFDCLKHKRSENVPEHFLPPSDQQDWGQPDTEYLARSNPFHSIPRKKLDNAIEDVSAAHSIDGILTPGGSKLIEAVTRYYESNIPVDYWFRDMHKFTGSESLVNAYQKVTKNVSKSYKNGARICFAGSYGVGKTMSCACILKRVVETGKYDALYVNLTDIVNIMASSNDAKQEARRLLMSVDFLVIDEFDQRFMGTDNAADLFGRILEPILRARIQNKLPLFLCTNSPNVVSSFTGALQDSIRSLMKVVQMVPILDFDDYRGKRGAK